MSDEPDAARPTLGGGLDDHDADAHNRHFADDILSGSPFGATVHGYKQLHAIHVRLLQQGRGGPSRYEIERVLARTSPSHTSGASRSIPTAAQ
jgi:hypothetical protein